MDFGHSITLAVHALQVVLTLGIRAVLPSADAGGDALVFLV